MNDTLVSAEIFHFNNVLIKMVRSGQISQNEREDLLHKSGLIKLSDGRWKESETMIISIANE